ncbi:hypothetical protein H257_18921 [Aphanomyces astaci]|uniref:Uncharacterized protein n=1 Tax=Aphanomyces astaci TaxID=112090 RepID=W4F9L7_APHAT|nr:hypothetical protein H257_18921 [Aphanomyces astaci]ETV64147.1 hypothetical protein H257_18921 [Aphanomyces astaci]|eukprot:XP_009846371.1 hypothetical protein H257_18921 [Aphanomyces astaci]
MVDEGAISEGGGNPAPYPPPDLDLTPVSFQAADVLHWRRGRLAYLLHRVPEEREATRQPPPILRSRVANSRRQPVGVLGRRAEPVELATHVPDDSTQRSLIVFLMRKAIPISHPNVVPTSEFSSLPRDMWLQDTTPDKTGSPLLVHMESTSPLQKDGSC